MGNVVCAHIELMFTIIFNPSLVFRSRGRKARLVRKVPRILTWKLVR